MIFERKYRSKKLSWPVKEPHPRHVKGHFISKYKQKSVLQYLNTSIRTEHFLLLVIGK